VLQVFITTPSQHTLGYVIISQSYLYYLLLLFVLLLLWLFIIIVCISITVGCISINMVIVFLVLHINICANVASINISLSHAHNSYESFAIICSILNITYFVLSYKMKQKFGWYAFNQRGANVSTQGVHSNTLTHDRERNEIVHSKQYYSYILIVIDPNGIINNNH